MVDAEPILYREEAVGLVFAVADILEEIRRIARFSTTMGKYKKIWNSKAERDAWEAHVDETIARLRGLAEKAWAELQAKKPPDPESRPTS